jgi:hypothetical protein
MCALADGWTRGPSLGESRGARLLELRGGRRRASSTAGTAQGAVPAELACEEFWDDAALGRRIAELKQGGPLKDFLDGLYLPTAPRGVPHRPSAADIIHPANRFAANDGPEIAANETALAHFRRIQRAFKRGQRGEPTAAESSSGSSVYGSTLWDSEKLEEAFPSEGDQDPLAYKCEYVQGPRVLKYISERRRERWHTAATERFNRLQQMDSDEFVDGVDNELKYERDIFQERVVNISGTKALVSKAPFFEGEAGYVGADGQAIPGPAVSHTRALTGDELARLHVREQARYDELYGKERVEQEALHAAREAGDEMLLEAEAVGFNASRGGGLGAGNATRSEAAEAGRAEGEGASKLKLRDKLSVFKKGDWGSEGASVEEQTPGVGGVEEGDSDLDFPVTLPYTEQDIYAGRGRPLTKEEDAGKGRPPPGVRGLGGGWEGIFNGLGRFPWNADERWKEKENTCAPAAAPGAMQGGKRRRDGVGAGEEGASGWGRAEWEEGAGEGRVDWGAGGAGGGQHGKCQVRRKSPLQP